MSGESIEQLGEVEGSSPSGLAHFFVSMDPRERRTFWACAAGWACDGLDFTIFPLVIGTIMMLWNVDAGLAGLATTGTLLFSAAGGWAVGFLSDCIGRVRALLFTIAWFGVCTVLCAIAQNFTQLLIFRCLLGFGFGGEWAAGAVLMSETIRPQFRGRAMGCVQSAWAIGWGGAVALQAVAFLFLPPEMAWRAMFLFGCVPAFLLLVYIVRSVEEPEIARQHRRSETVTDRPSPFAIFAPGIRGTTILAALALTGAQGGYYAITAWLPAYLSVQRGIDMVNSAGYLATLIAGSFAGYLVGAWLADLIGRRRLFLVFSLGAIVVVIIYTQVELGDALLAILGFPLGFFSSGYYSGAGAFLAELFPTRLRGSGQGFTYNFGRGVGALFPALVGYLSLAIPLGTAIAIFATIAYLLFFCTAFCLPETRGRSLDE